MLVNRSPVGQVALRLGVKLDIDDLRIISALYFGGVRHAALVRASVRLSRLTFFLRLRRLKRASLVSGGSDAVNAGLHNLNLTLSARRTLFALEAEIRSAGVFGGRLVGDGTGPVGERLSYQKAHGLRHSPKGARQMGMQWVN
jgi:hypothetical protein